MRRDRMLDGWYGHLVRSGDVHWFLPPSELSCDFILLASTPPHGGSVECRNSHGKLAFAGLIIAFRSCGKTFLSQGQDALETFVKLWKSLIHSICPQTILVWAIRDARNESFQSAMYQAHPELVLYVARASLLLFSIFAQSLNRTYLSLESGVPDCPS